MVGKQWNHVPIHICVCRFYILVYHSVKEKWI